MERLCLLNDEGALSPEGVAAFRQIIYGHFHRHGRDFPWRRTDDPYQILVSEIMLQQTQVERVARWYDRFLSAFPDLATLAQAPVHEILRVWQGLGYNRRALSLKRLACRVAEEFGGRLPDSMEVLRTLPGIGPATAGAIAAFAFNRPAVFLETNIRRVFLHFFFPRATGVSDRQLLPLVGHTLDPVCPRLWYYALMDYGAKLKMQASNANRRSAHYRKQSLFENSERQIRSRILQMLLDNSPLHQERVEEAGGQSPARIRRVISQLVAEGFLEQREGLLSINSS
jgi:A/G-specific adenine glycosylase